MALAAKDWDVIVVGCGYAGAVAAICAADAGKSVLVLEKMAQPGGISVCSAGGIRVADSAVSAFNYLQATNGGTAPDQVLRTLAKKMTEIEVFVRDLAAQEDFSVKRAAAPGNYPFPGSDTFAFVTVGRRGGDSNDPMTTLNTDWIRGGVDGLALFEMVYRGLHRRAVTIQCNTHVKRLRQNACGEVVGVSARQAGELREFSARGGVILACGGFEADPAMQKQFWSGMTARSAAFAGNTGDGIRMAQAVGADLWHMWHFHGSYGICHPDTDYPFSIRTRRFPDWVPGDPPRDDVQMPWILVDQRGERFMNEYEPYLQDTGARPFAFFDTASQSFPRIPAFLIADAAGCDLHPFGRPAFHSPGQTLAWGDDNAEAIRSGILREADSVHSLATMLQVPADRLRRTLSEWNASCQQSIDPKFGRPGPSMMPLLTPPFYVAEVEPLVNNTQGGPVHDAQQRILDPFGAPVGGLYAAGELGSVFGYLYISGGNIAECFIGGRIAGKAAASRAGG